MTACTPLYMGQILLTINGMQVEFERLPVQAAVPQSTCFCLLDYSPRGFRMPQHLDTKRTQKLLRALILAKLAAA